MATKKSESTKMSREQAEYNRLSVLYERIPANKRALVDGLLVQAARLRVSLDDLYEDLQKNGNTEMFKQANDGVEFPRERPESKIFATRDKSYMPRASMCQTRKPRCSAQGQRGLCGAGLCGLQWDRACV